MRSLANPVLDTYPNPRSNVFLMMRFRPTEYHGHIGETIAAVLSEYSMNLVRADSNDYLSQLWDNVEACMDACSYGIAVFEQIDDRDINPNVSLELGYMRGQRKKCLILKEKRLPTLQTDLSGYLYSEFDAFHIAETVEAQVRRWLRSIGIAKKSNERLLVFVSAGGTCRCAMAKAITEQLLDSNPPGYPLRVLSAAMYEPSLPGASEGARRAVRDMFGGDLLASHRVVRLSPTLVNEADLILTMDHALYGVLQKAASVESHESNKQRVHVLKPYFGLEGDVADPWAYQGTAEEAERYAETAKELRSIIEANLNQIVQTLDPKPSERGDHSPRPEQKPAQGGDSPDAPISIFSERTATVTVIIELTATGTRFSCEIPLDIRAELILAELNKKLELPTALVDGRPLEAHLFSRTQNRNLEGAATLRDNGVRDREILQIHWSGMTAG